MINHRLAELLSRRMSGEATTDELLELQEWMQSHPGNQYFVDILFNYWNSPNDASRAADEQADQHFAHILEMAEKSREEDGLMAILPAIGKKTFSFHWLKRMAAAAIVVGVIASGIWIYKNNALKTAGISLSKRNEIVAGKGTRSKMTLPDGTQVWLNSDSKLQYQEAFNDTLREVYLDGEAYFDVVKNPQRPFIVHTDGIDIRVLGTAFNVKSYAKDKTIEATLIHGLIEVTNKNKPGTPKIILRPKEKLVFLKNEEDQDAVSALKQVSNKAISEIAISALPHNVADSSLAETSWVYNRLVFEGETFADAALKMERWFNVKIHINDENIASSRFGASFEDENIEQTLQALQIITPFKYKINENEIEITR